MADIDRSDILLEGGSVLSQASLNWLIGKVDAFRLKQKEKKEGSESWARVANQLAHNAIKTADRFAYVCPIAFPQTRMEFEKIYVPLTVICENRHNKFSIDRFPSVLFRHGKGKCLVLDAAGMGKTTIARKIFIQALKECVALPFFVDLRRLASGKSLDSLIAENCSVRDVDRSALSEFISRQKCIYILDGFDEISESIRSSCDREIRRFIDSCCENSVFLLTSRPDSDFSIFSDFERYGIKELSVEEAHGLIRKYGAYGGAPDLLIDALGKTNSDAVSSFLENPLLTSLLFRAFEHRSIVPIKRNVFYRQVYESLFEAHDLNKEAGFSRAKKTGLHLDEMHRLLRAISSKFYQAGKIELSYREFKSAFEAARRDWMPELAVSFGDFSKDITSAVPVFVRDGDFVRWAHKSLMDYFVAEFFASDFEGDKSSAISKMVDSVDARKRFNVISVIAEICPLIYSEACVLPALNRLLEDMNKIKGRIKSSIRSDVREFIVSFFGCYEIFILYGLPSRGGLSSTEFENVLSEEHRANYRPVMVSFHIEGICMVVAESKAVLPLRASVEFKAASMLEYMFAEESPGFIRTMTPTKSDPVIRVSECIGVSMAALKRRLDSVSNGFGVADFLPPFSIVEQRKLELDASLSEMKRKERDSIFV